MTPDGSFVDVVRGGNGRFALWRMPFLGGTPRKLIADVETTVAWSPDGANIAFVRRNFARGETSLIVADGEGRGERVLALQRDPLPFSSLTNSLGYPPAWSPDGSIIAVAAVVSPGGAAVVQHLVFVDVSTGSVRTLPLPEQISNQGGLGWLDRDRSAGRTSGPGLPRQLWRLSYPRADFASDERSERLPGVGLTADRTMLVTARTETHRGVWIVDGAANGADAVLASWSWTASPGC